MKKIQKTLLIGISLLSVVGLTVMPATPALAQCETAILPDSLCQNSTSGEVEDTGVWGLLLFVLNILTAGVGVVALGGIIYGAVLYTSAGGNQDQVKKAVGVITNVVIGIVAYALMFTLLNFLIPGGIFAT